MADAAVHYRLKFHDLNAHLFRVQITVSNPDPDGQCFRLPAWVPGSYLIRDFAGRVVQVTGRDAAGEYAPHRLDKSSWHCRPASGAVELELLIHAFDDSVRAAWLDADYGFANPAALLPEALRQTGPLRLDVDLPPANDWQLATSMPVLDVDARGFGSFECSDYRELIDHPLLAGDLQCFNFEAMGCRHRIWVQGNTPARTDWDRLVSDVCDICTEHLRMFGSQPPMPAYDFLLRVCDSGYGGLEHRASTALLCARADLPLTGQSQSAGYRKLLGLFSHEYFHLWNVKRIQPQAVADSALDSEAPFADLWAYEGITSYYDNLAMLRAGVIETNRYLGLLADDINRLQQSPGRRGQSLVESSYDAWIKLYRPGPESANIGISYYNKGALVALMLDLYLRLNSTSTLEEVMQVMFERYDLHSQPAPEHALERVAAEVSGIDLQDFMARWVYGCDELLEKGGLPDLLAEFGVSCTPHVARADADRLLAMLGVKLSEPVAVGMPVPVSVVLADGAGQQAGLLPGDELVALNGRRVSMQNVITLLDGLDIASPLQLQFFRDGYLRQTGIDCSKPALQSWSCKLISEPSDNQRKRRQAWLQPEGSAGQQDLPEEE